MVINERGFVIFHAAKTGGTSMRRFFKDDEGARHDLTTNQHETPQELEKRLPQTKDWAKYVVIRNPWERMESAYKHFFKYHSGVEGWVFSDFAEHLTTEGSVPWDKRKLYPMKEQSHYMGEGITVLDFDIMSIGAHAIAHDHGAQVPETFPHLHISPKKDCHWTQEALAVFEAVYADDIAYSGHVFRGELK